MSLTVRDGNVLMNELAVQFLAIKDIAVENDVEELWVTAFFEWLVEVAGTPESAISQAMMEAGEVWLGDYALPKNKKSVKLKR